MSSERQNAEINNGLVDREFTVGDTNSAVATNENTINIQTLERSHTDRIARKIGNVVGTVEVRIQNAVLITI